MKNINRNEFLKTSMKASALVALAQFGSPLLSFAQSTGQGGDVDTAFMDSLVAANDTRVGTILQAGRVGAGRALGQDFAFIASAFASPGSKYYHDAKVVDHLQKLTNTLLEHQSEDGTLNAGNLESPPDTAFLMESLTCGAYILQKDNSASMKEINGQIKKFSQKVGEALIHGGVHTPNHRWVVCQVLARLNELYPDKRYLTRIEDWLGEGVFQDKDGHYPERSQNYADVENNSMITLGRLLNRPAMFDYARKNLDMAYYYMDPNGDLTVNDSRRQDQWSSKSIMAFYLHYRYLAIKQNNGMFAAVAKFIETLPGFDKDIINNRIYDFLENPVLQQQLPKATELPVNFEKLFTTSSLLRIRRNDTTVTLFGGCDLPTIIASGRSNSPNFFAYRKGKAILKYMRLSSSFFSMGYFYSDGMKKEGNKYVLYRKLTAPYYQPLPKDKRKKDGDYKLSPSIDDRFWNKMDFSNRPVSNVKSLESKVTLTENNGAVQLDFEVTGPEGVSVTIELCFNEGGKLSGVTTAPENQNASPYESNYGRNTANTPGEPNSFLTTGEGSYEFGNDKITFGPGTGSVRAVRGLEGERYSTHFGSLRTKGMYVYLTGNTPFKHTLKLS
ncbi:hypothetical protein LZZ85_03055 [Terrimonas sp. NA20]|uniref:Alginate lyase domain-containing protein n=1 Tax=Terrimonas ginsenosidimutans TaxID=2908004 RepID=A0ABS9KLN9_9BACT|nr:hypothetical protein [Terrimonas ginsenosidimutans]MCG2613236.1 hypothetical protein [Terrimonas ginsenosidimutans]